MEAVMGDDEKLIGDICAAAKDLHPKFIAVAGTPIPTMIGFDFKAVASLIEQRTGIRVKRQRVKVRNKFGAEVTVMQYSL